MTDQHGTSRRGFLRAAAGAGAVAGAAGGAAAQEGNSSAGGNQTGGNQTGGNQTGGNQTGGGSGGGTKTYNKTVEVGPDNKFVFKPETVTITPGSTVTWNWKSNNHNIVVQSQPKGANWEGTKGPSGKTYNSGHTYSHTFEKLGTYEYYCQPHRQQGMTGTVEVVEEISTPAPEQGPPQVPGTAKTLSIATLLGLGSTLGLAYFFMKYGGDYETPDE